MAKLVLSDLAFGNVGFEIGSDLDLENIALSMSGILERDFFFDSLDLTSVTITGLTVNGTDAPPGIEYGEIESLYMGDLSILDPTAAITRFEVLRLTNGTVDSHGTNFTINSGSFKYSDAGTVLFDSWLDTFDFSDVNDVNDVNAEGLKIKIEDDAGDSFTIIGGQLADDIRYLGEGFVSISGGGGDDVLDGGPGIIAYIKGDEGDDVIYGGDGDDTLSGGLGDDEIFGRSGFDSVYGEDGDDTLYGGEGEDSLNGGDGDDNIFGEKGDDEIYGDTGDDDLNGDSGDDLLEGGAGRDNLSGWDGDDILFGGDDDDLLVGEYGNDFLDGGAGNDRLYPRIGKDRLEGGSGRDRFEVSTADKHYYTSGDPVTDSVVSPTNDAEEQDEILDFSASDDLFILSEGQLVRGYSPFENTTVLFSKGTDSNGHYVRFVEDGDWESDSTVRDETGAIDSGNLLFRVPQYDPSEYEPSEYKALDKAFLTESEATDGLYVAQYEPYESYNERYEAYDRYYKEYDGYYEEHDGSYEVHFASASQSQGPDFDIFSNVKFHRDDSGSITSGQDKFDLRRVSDHRYEPGDTEIANIIFTIIEDDDSWGTAIDLLNGESGNTTVDDFFYDTSADGSPKRAVHVEYLAQRGGEGYDSLMVYFDADEDGSFSLNSDLFFQILDPQKADGSFYDNDLISADLYDDPSGDGSGTGIFIFNVDQYNFWYT